MDKKNDNESNDKQPCAYSILSHIDQVKAQETTKEIRDLAKSFYSTLMSKRYMPGTFKNKEEPSEDLSTVAHEVHRDSLAMALDIYLYEQANYETILHEVAEYMIGDDDEIGISAN